MDFIVVLFLIVLLSGANTNFICPSSEQWKFREQICPSAENYTCLWDEVNNFYNEQCSGPKLERKGHKLNINKGYLNRAYCSNNRYQPVQFTTVGNSDCLLHKSACTDIGQVKVDNGSSTTDVKCNCDYTRSYAPVENTSHPCYCIPSEEDCSCYKKKCSTEEVLSPDYKCTTDVNYLDRYQCQLLNGTDVKPPTTESRLSNGTKDNQKSTTDADNALICIIIFILLYIVVLVVHWRKNILSLIRRAIEAVQDFFRKVVITNPLKVTICLEHDNVTLDCEVSKDGMTPKWRKGEKEKVRPDTKFSFSSNHKKHVLTIKDVGLNDGGKYSIHFKNLESSAYLIVLESMSKEEENFVQLEHCMQVIAEPIVRTKFDAEFAPDTLDKNLQQSSKAINDLLQKRIINLAEYDLLLPRIVTYEVNIVFSELEYTPELNNKTSKEFENIEKTIEQDITKLYADVPGHQAVEGLKFNPVNLRVELELKSHLLNDTNLDVELSHSIVAFGIISDRFHVDQSSGVKEVYVVFNDLEYKSELEDENSEDFQELGKKIKAAVAHLLSNIDEKIEIKILKIKPQFVGVTICLTTKDFYKEKKIRETVEEAVLKDKWSLKTCSGSFRFKFLTSVSLKPSSKSFTIRLMIILMRNLLRYDIPQELPQPSVTTDAANLARINYYRKKIAQSKRMVADTDFKEISYEMKKALEGLARKCVKMIWRASSRTALKELQSKLDPSSSQNIEHSKEDETDTGDDSGTSSENKEKQLHKAKIAYSLNKLLDGVAREKFNEAIPPQSFPRAVLGKQKDLEKLYQDKKLTKTQWDSLKYRAGTPLSSENLEISLLIRLLWMLSDTRQRNAKLAYDDFEGLQQINSLTDGLRKLTYDEKELEEIIKLCKRLGGDKLFHICLPDND